MKNCLPRRKHGSKASVSHEPHGVPQRARSTVSLLCEGQGQYVWVLDSRRSRLIKH